MTVYGRIDCYFPAGRYLYAPTPNYGALGRNYMKMTWDALNHFASLGLCELVAWFKGTGASAGSDGPDGANPWGTNGWFLFRFPPTVNRTWPWYFHMQVNVYPVDFGIANHPALLLATNQPNSYEQLGIQVARGIGSANSVWNGTTHADGTDTKGTEPYWVVPSGGTRVAVLPRSNGPAGTHVTGKQNFSPIIKWDSDYAVRASFLTDGDALVIADTFDGAAYTLRYYGALETLADLTDGTLVCMHNTPPWGLNSDYGDLGGNYAWAGGIDVVGQERIYRIDQQYGSSGSNLSVPTFHPNTLYSPARYDADRIPILSNEGLKGCAGWLKPELVEQSFCLATNTVNGDATRAFFSNGGSTAQCVSLAWDGASTPGINMTRTGIDFQR